MTELLRVGPGDRVLDIGTGSGYQAAVLAELGCAGHVDRAPCVAGGRRHASVWRALGYGDRVEIRVGDGAAARPTDAPWRRDPRRRRRLRASRTRCGPSSIRTAAGWSSRSGRGIGSR